MDKTQKICQEMMITVNVNKIMEYYVVGLAKVLRFYNLSINPISCHAGLIIQSIFEQHSKFAIGFFLKKRSVQNSCQPAVQNYQQLGVTNMGCEHRSSDRYFYMNFESWTVLGSRGCREKKRLEQASGTCFVDTRCRKKEYFMDGSEGNNKVLIHIFQKTKVKKLAHCFTGYDKKITESS